MISEGRNLMLYDEEKYAASLDKPIHELYLHLRTIEYLVSHDTLSDEFQIWAECKGVFEKYAKRRMAAQDEC